MELFRNLGIVDAFLREGQISRGARVYLNGTQRASVDFDIGRDDTPYPFLFTLSQAKTEKILAEDLARQGKAAARGVRLVNFLQTNERVLCRVSDPKGGETEISARYVVGCDGSHSAVRKTLGLEFKGGKYGHEFVMADTEVEWDLSHEYLHAFLDKRGIGVYFPQKGNGQARVITVRPYDKSSAPVTTETSEFPATLDEVAEGFRSASKRSLTLKNAAWVTRFHVHHRCVDHFRVGRVFLAGDAAHIHSPLGAQGMNTGLQDAANLAWKLAVTLRHREGATLLETYESERLPVARALLRTTDRLFKLFTTKNRFLLALRSLAIPVVGKTVLSRRAGRRFAFRFISQLGIHYGASKRVPNVTLEDGRELFDLISGYQCHVLAVGTASLETLPDVWWKSAKVHRLEAEPKLLAALGMEGPGLIGVRPDGYEGFRA